MPILPFTIKHRENVETMKRYAVVFPGVWSEAIHLAPTFQSAMSWATRYQDARALDLTHEEALDLADGEPLDAPTIADRLTVAQMSAKGNASPKRDRKASGAKMRATMIERYGPDYFKKIRHGEKPSA